MAHELNDLLTTRAERGEHRGADTLMGAARRELDPTRGTVAPYAQRRPGWIPALGGVIAVMVMVGGVALLMSPGSPTTTTLPSAASTTTLPSVASTTASTAVVTTEAPPIPTMSWEGIPEPGFEEHAVLEAAVQLDTGLLVVVGGIQEIDPTNPFPQSHTAAWVSSDGRTWERVDSDGFGGENTAAGRMLAVVEVPNGLVGISTTYQRDGVIWLSPDGRSWERIDEPALGGDGAQLMDFLAAGPGGLVAAGYGERDVVIAVSPDGRSWSRIEDSDLEVPMEWINDLVAGDFGYVLIGQERVSEFTMRPAMWVSPNGTDWDRIPSGTFDNGDPVYTTTNLADIGVTSDGGLVVLDSWDNAWLSYDGYDWDQLETGEIPPTDVVFDGDRVLAETADGLVASPDRGVTWGPVDSDSVDFLTRFGAGFIAFSTEPLSTGMDTTFSHVVWLGSWSDSG
jgi:hypothetical protein